MGTAGTRAENSITASSSEPVSLQAYQPVAAPLVIRGGGNPGPAYFPPPVYMTIDIMNPLCVISHC